MSANEKKLAKAWRICNFNKNKYNWSDKKTERCVKAVKKNVGYKEPIKKKS